MEVRWRLFARDVLSLLIDDTGEFYFGRPQRRVRALRLLGVVVHKARREKVNGTTAAAVVGGGDGRGMGGNKQARGGGGGGCSGGGDSTVEGDFGLICIGGFEVQSRG